MRKLYLVLAMLICFSSAYAHTPVKYTISDQGYQREYYLYIPENAGEQAPLVIVMHGYGGKADGYRPEMMDVAARHGFAVCYPQAIAGPKSKPGWNVRYDAQEGMTVDDVKFIKKLVAHLQKKHNFSKKNTFCSGMSNGGEMCYLFAYRSPETFAAYASVAGLTMTWMAQEFNPTKPVAFMEVHGTADMTSKWDGDPRNEGGWGAYLPVPMAVGTWVAFNDCTEYVIEELPLKDKEKPSRQVTLTKYLGGTEGKEVWLYKVQDGKHTWALSDLDTCEEIWKFFSKYLK